MNFSHWFFSTSSFSLTFNHFHKIYSQPIYRILFCIQLVWHLKLKAMIPKMIFFKLINYFLYCCSVSCPTFFPIDLPCPSPSTLRASPPPLSMPHESSVYVLCLPKMILNKNNKARGLTPSNFKTCYRPIYSGQYGTDLRIVI